MIHRFTPIKYYFTFGPHEPSLELEPGDILVAPTVDAGGYDSLGKPLPEEMKQRREDTIYLPANPLVGPFYIKEANLKDTLMVYIERILPNRETAYSRIAPNFGSLTEEGPGKRLLFNEPLKERVFSWKLDLDRQVGILDLPKSRKGMIEVPLHPFIGSIGVAPRYGRHETSLTPGEYGGNMDCPEIKEGTTLYLPIFVQGAYLAFGDIHAAQGDGELCGSGLETSAEVKLKIDVIRGKTIEWPRLEDEDYLMVAGSSRPLLEALKIANVEMVNWLVTDFDFEKWEALQVLSQVGLVRIGNIVDPNYTVAVKFPKEYLP